MTAVRIGESVRYGLRLYGYVLGITVLGAAGVGLGAALALPEIAAWRGPGQAEVVPGIAGGLLLFLGLSVLVIGYLGAAYKLLADGVAAGSAGPSAEPDVVDEAVESATAAEATVAEESESGEVASADPNVGAGEPAAGSVAGAAASGTDVGNPPTDDATEVGSMAPEEDAAAESAESDRPPEPSPEEIAFGTSSDDADDEAATAEEPTNDESTTDSTPTSGPLPGENAASDPLADPSDE